MVLNKEKDRRRRNRKNNLQKSENIRGSTVKSSKYIVMIILTTEK